MDVPYYEQFDESACVPVSLRMILAFWGVYKTEAQLYRDCQTTRNGTSILGCVQATLQYQLTTELWLHPKVKPPLYKVLHTTSNFSPNVLAVLDSARILTDEQSAWQLLQQTIDSGKPAITFLNLGDSLLHVVVATDITTDGDTENVWVNDPAVPDRHPMPLAKEGFLQAWQDACFYTVVLYR